MKKFFIAASLMTIMLASCTSKNTSFGSAQDNDSIAEVVDSAEVVVDTVATDTVVVE